MKLIEIIVVNGTHQNIVIDGEAIPISRPDLIMQAIVFLLKMMGINVCVFTARSYLRAGEFYLNCFKKEMESKLEMHYHHVKEEGENLKKILENL